MNARDVMVSPVITVKPHSSVKELVKVFLQRRISAAPIVDDNEKLVGIVSEGDLLHRIEAGTERRRSWWLAALTGDETLAADYVNSHGRKISDVMTRAVVTATPDTPLHEIASLLEKHAIKRVPIIENGQLVGIVSRANLIQALASSRPELAVSVSDVTIRDRLMAHLKGQRWAHDRFAEETINFRHIGEVVA